ncbi:midnolin homolog [Uranotaenia lowii]|uniref:midnolin homolog n=1 Tax=Uranotaenia lowii TaxID=190385 RepID=UPI002478CB1F|nr:midnolin homolog [Uranotaenia lowii]
MDKSGGGGGDPRDAGPSSSSASSSSPSTSSTSSSASGSSSSSTVPLGCGTGSGSSLAASAATPINAITLNVTTTTGGSFSIVVDGENSVENLKKIISKKLKVSKDRICLLHRERELHDGSLRDNGLMDGSKLILTPNVETGLLAQRAENTVMQALESLNDNQVNDFLSGKSPLNLSVRLGDHMMLIQLQLSTLNPSSQSSGSRSKNHKSRAAIGTSLTGSSAGSSLIQASAASSSRSHSSRSVPITGFRRVTTTESTTTRPIMQHVSEAQTLTKQEIESIHSIVKNLAESDNPTMASTSSVQFPAVQTESAPKPAASESPIKSLSNLVSSSIDSNIPQGCSSNNNSLPVGPASPCSDPITAKLTSCLCKRLDGNDNSSCDSDCSTRDPEPQPSTSTANLHRTAHNPISRHKTKIQTLKKHLSFDSSTLAKTDPDTVQPIATTSVPSSPQRPEQVLPQLYPQYLRAQPQPGPSNPTKPASNITDPNNFENPALAEASRNLTQTLRKLSKRVFTNKVGDVSQETARNVSSGAVIESMKHHGKGIYSGTFSGTLNPALQDKFGRPKRDISTIIHILNDLLSAAPQCARSGTKIYFEPSTSSAAAGGSSSTTTVASTSTAAGSTSSHPGSALISSGSSSLVAQTSSAAGSHVTAAGGSNSTGSNVQAAAVMAPSSSATFTTPMAAPSPRLVSRCIPTPIYTKKYPGNGSSAIAASGVVPNNAGHGCLTCKTLLESAAATGQPSTSYIRCHHQHHHHHHHHYQQQQQQQQSLQQHKVAVSKVLCRCGHSLTTVPGQTQPLQCQRCAAISAAELENSKTKSKLDSLRLIMQQKKERREARKQKTAPYTVPSAASVSTPPPSTASLAAPAMVASIPRTLLMTGNPGSSAMIVDEEEVTAAACSSSSETSPATTSTSQAASGSTSSSESSGDGSSTNTNTSTASSTSNNPATATATATTTTATAAAAAATATSTEAAQSHQIVEEVDTVA